MPKKMILDIDNELWKDVVMFKVRNDFKNNNDAVIELIKRSLKNKHK